MIWEISFVTLCFIYLLMGHEQCLNGRDYIGCVTAKEINHEQGHIDDEK